MALNYKKNIIVTIIDEEFINEDELLICHGIIAFEYKEELLKENNKFVNFIIEDGYQFNKNYILKIRAPESYMVESFPRFNYIDYLNKNMIRWICKNSIDLHKLLEQ